MSQVHNVTRSKDGFIRRVCVKDINHQENKLRLAGGTVVSLVNLLTLDVSYLMHAMAEVETLSTNVRKEKVLRKRKPAKLISEDRHYKNKGQTVGGAMLGVCLDYKRTEDIASLPINCSKSSLLLSKLRTFCNMFEIFKTSFNLCEEVGQCVNRVWLQVSGAVGLSLDRTEFSTTTQRLG